MIRKTLPAILIVLTLIILTVQPAFAAKVYRAERFDVQLDLQSDGSALVTETVVFRFDGGPFTFAFREIDQTETDGVTFLDANLDGARLPPGTNANQVEISRGNRLKVTWHFDPTSDAAREFVVRYRVAGLVRKLDTDMIRWRAIPQDHDYPIDRTSITLTYPNGVRPIEPPTLDRAFESTPLADGFRLTTIDISTDQAVILTARFPTSTVASSAPQWQIRQQQFDATASRALPIGLLASAMTLVLGGFGLFAHARAHRRDVPLSNALLSDTPPGDVPPALVGKLTQQSNGFMGTLFDLAQRGVLEVREDKGWWGTKKFILLLKTITVSLRPHEQGLLDALFKPGATTVEMSQISTRLASKHKLFDAPLEQELIDRGWLDPERKRQRTRIGVTGFLMLLATMSLFLVGILGAGAAFRSEVDLASVWAALIGFAAGGFVISIGVLIYSATFSPLTSAGEEEAARWKGYALYLKQASKGRQPNLSPDYFERYLPFAAAFGLGSAWAKYFQRIGGVPIPAWFHTLAGSNGDFGAMVAVMSASDSAGASAAGGGGAGASGGGSSGAG